ncbi:hypothetical protein [Viridibacillus sp. FSL H8-0123]|uniref:hypothetical protein n=1 Tax=Viridibacillus sp. FSL H8-0123 TaxID=1928922 RepID=UPI00096E3BFA|nr:hypothetical protein [Viridibacillus sp. FSL H8-0123]OMC83346.1 hypothetical protein BK130_07300 [Viridibacillus sp. FSL H8-0123]
MKEDFGIERMINEEKLIKKFNDAKLEKNIDDKLFRMFYEPQHEKNVDDSSHKAYFMLLDSKFKKYHIKYVKEILSESIKNRRNAQMVFMGVLAILFTSIAIITSILAVDKSTNVSYFVVCTVVLVEIFLVAYYYFLNELKITRKQKIVNLLTYYLELHIVEKEEENRKKKEK